MPFDGSGQFTRDTGEYTGPDAWDRTAEARRGIRSDDFDTHINDIIEGLELAWLRDGQNTPTANLSMGNNRLTSLGAATSGNDAATLNQVRELGFFVPAAGVSGTGDAITLAPAPVLTSHAIGLPISFFVETVNTGPATVAVNTLSAAALKRQDGSDVAANELYVGRYVTIAYNGTDYISNILPPNLTNEDFLINNLTQAAIADDDLLAFADVGTADTPNRAILASDLRTYMQMGLTPQTFTVNGIASAAVANEDLFVFSDQGEAGDPNRTITASDLRTYMQTGIEGFDLHDDVPNPFTALQNSDRMLISAESLTGDPNRYVTLQTLASFFAFDVHDDLGAQITALADNDRLPISDESLADDPNRYVTIAQLRSEFSAELNRNGAALSAAHDPPASFDGTAALTVTFTPGSTSSKVLLKASIVTNDTTTWGVRFRRGGSTTIRSVTGIVSDGTPTANQQGEPVVVEALDSPASTSQQSYTLEFQGGAASRISAGTFLLLEEVVES